MNYNKIPKTGTIGQMVDSITANFQLTKEMLERLDVTKDRAMGLFSSQTALQTAYPSPEVGDWALVGDTSPFAVFKCTTAGIWSDTGGTYDGGDINLSEYLTKADANNRFLNLESQVSETDAKLDNKADKNSVYTKTEVDTKFAKRAFTFSDNDEVNKYIDEIYIANPSSDFTQTRVSFYFATFSSTYNKYYNNIRVGGESDISKFVNIFFGYYDTLQEAIDALHTYKGIQKVGQNYIKCDFSDFVISESYKKGYNCSYYDTTVLHNSPAIENYVINEEIDSLDKQFNQLKQEQIQGGVYDVSAHNNSAVFESLQALLNSPNLSTLIPISVRHGGMSIRFINSDNKYVQFLCIADEFTADTTKWAICDDGVLIDNPEWIRVVIDKDGRILAGIKSDGSVEWSLGVPTPIREMIKKGDDTKVDKEDGKSLVDAEFSEGISYIENPEFECVYTDYENKILFGVQKDGNIYYGAGVPQQVIDYIEEKLADLSLSTIDNPEFLDVTLDDEDKILAGRTPDGAAFENVGFSTPKVSIDGHNLENIEDPEGRYEITFDSENKIISFRKPDGTLVENVGVKTNHLELTKQGMNDFQQALKDSGFRPGGGGDWSDKEVVEVPHPTRYAILNFHIGQLPKYDGEVKEGYAEYYDGLGNYFKKAVKLETQGQSSRIFARTGNRGNYTLDIDDGSEIKFGSWVPQDSFHLKGTPKDITHGIFATSYKWAYMFMEYLNAKPNRVLLKDSSKITTTNASGDRFTDWIDDARCLPDGFPVEIYVEGEYWGLYALQLKKHRKNYSIKKSDYTSLFIDADMLLDSDYQHGFWLDGVDSAAAGTTGKTWWNYFDIKGPKDLVCMDGSAFDGDNPKELIDSTSPVYDSSNKKHKGSAQAKAIIRGFSTKYLEVKELIDNNNIEGAKAKFNENFDYNACMLVYIFNCLMRNGDSIKKNTLWGTWKNGKIAPMLWDIDGVYGTDWWGGTCGVPGAGMWTGGYATSAWPLSFMWTLYQDEIKATYAELRSHGIIDMNTWKSIVFGWANQIGTEAFDRDIEKWPEMPSYRENYTNTEYWQEYGSSSAYSTYPAWDENTSYSVGDIVVIKIHPQVGWYLRYRAVQASDANNPQCPVTKFYEAMPQVGGYYDSPKRMEKWMEEQIRLCDIVMKYN